MPSVESRLKKLEKKAAKAELLLKKAKADMVAGKGGHNDLKKRVAALEKDVADIVKWIKAEVKWSKEVTKMLREIDWVKLKAAYPAGGAMNPPQTPPDWPMG